MISVGYSKNTATAKCSEITKHPVYIRTLNNFLESLEDKRAQTMAYLTEKDIKKATLRDKVYAVDTFSKNINLLTGKPTENVNSISVLLDLIEDKNKDTNQANQ